MGDGNATSAFVEVALIKARSPFCDSERHI